MCCCVSASSDWPDVSVRNDHQNGCDCRLLKKTMWVWCCCFYSKSPSIAHSAVKMKVVASFITSNRSIGGRHTSRQPAWCHLGLTGSPADGSLPAKSLSFVWGNQVSASIRMDSQQGRSWWTFPRLWSRSCVNSCVTVFFFLFVFFIQTPSIDVLTLRVRKGCFHECESVSASAQFRTLPTRGSPSRDKEYTIFT